ncbi:hypothetical protein [Azospirillum sp.]|uniref:hypothetical protein n=1 Tax=Azospirillum sp. TaxID=34012 RepID=UPI003D754307
MTQPLRASDIAAVMRPPEALRALPDFVPGVLTPDRLADLKRRADAARAYAVSVHEWAGRVEWTAARIAAEAAPDAVLPLERTAITLLWMARSAEGTLGPLVERCAELRGRIAETATEEEWAQWTGFLELGIPALQRVIDTANDASRRAFSALYKAAPALYPRGIGDLDPERLRDERAVYVYQAFVAQELGLESEPMGQSFGDDLFRVLGIRVPPGTDKPHRVYRAALDRVHARVREAGPEFAGRIGFEFLRGPHAS